MLQTLVALITVLTGLAAVFGFALGVSRTARLRRREQLLREALSVLPSDHKSRDVTAELHRAALAEIVARQLTSPWRVTWPWAAWLVMAAVYAQTGYLISQYIASTPNWTYGQLSVAVFAGDLFPTAIMGIAAVFGVFPSIYQSYAHTLVGRAEMARRFFDGRSVRLPLTYMEVSVQADLSAGQKSKAQRRSDYDREYGSVGKALKARLGHYLRSLLPGLAVLSFGLNAGIMYWLAAEADRAAAMKELGAWPTWTILSLTVFGSALVWVAQDLTLEVRRYALPSVFPRTRIQLPGQLR